MKQLKTDILVIGSGIAGLYYAYLCSAFSKVLVITKGKIGESNTRYAQGGISAVFDENDSIENHIRDTLVAGDGLCNEKIVRLIAGKARQSILSLTGLNVHFDKTSLGEFDLHREGGHSFARVVHAADATGNEVESSLVKAVRQSKNISVVENYFAIDLLTDKNTCSGVIAINEATNEVYDIRAKIVMLATGGAGQVYLQNTNPSIATGDGFAMAKRAGAMLQNMEFVQFHPTILYAPGKEAFLITEAIRGFGGELKDESGKSFMERYHPMKSLAPRDVVSRAIVSEMKKSSAACVYVDLRGFDEREVKKHFPNIYKRCREEGLSLTRDMIPVVPAAHYMCGGVMTDRWGRTTVKNLYACGEVTCTGVHGANRLASNSLLEGLVFARQAALDSKKILPEQRLSLRKVHPVRLHKMKHDGESGQMKTFIQTLMWKYTGITRNAEGLSHCLQELEAMRDVLTSKISTDGFSVRRMEVMNMIETSLMITSRALIRRESRGCHYREDFPQKQSKTLNSFIRSEGVFY